MFETREVTQFGHWADSRCEVDSAHRLQSKCHWMEPPTDDGLMQSQLQPLALREAVPNRAPMLVERQLLSDAVERDSACVLAPVGTVEIVDAVGQQERFEPAACCLQIFLFRELARAWSAARVHLRPSARARLTGRGRADHAVEAFIDQPSVQAIPT